MKKIILSLAFLSFTSLGFAQKKGIQFKNSLTWQQVKALAKAENKYIFLDVYATWCGPCKAMDKDVYVNEQVGALFNEKFISVKVQADTSKIDSQEIKSWYADAEQIISDNKVNGFPTLLFFSPEGKLADRGIGYKDVQQILELAGNTANPQKQYYSLLGKFKEGTLDYNLMPDLVRRAVSFNELELAKSITETYFNGYLRKVVDDNLLLTKNSLLFIANEGSKLLRAKDRIFQLIYREPQVVNKIVGADSYAQGMISFIIIKEEIFSKLWTPDLKPITRKPNWEQLRSSIQRKYNQRYADSLISPAQFNFYSIIKDWAAYAQYVELALKKYQAKRGGKAFSIANGGLALMGPANDAWALNGNAWTIFENSDDPVLLKKALSWSDLSIKLENPNSSDAHQYYDTKANILYKMGRTKAALEAEKKAIEVLTASSKAMLKDVYTKKYCEIIDKMKCGEITWKTITDHAN